MKIALICEPRSGSQNLFKWLYLQESFTCFFKTGENHYEKPKNIDNFSNGLKEIYNDCIYDTKHLAIKEDYYVGSDMNSLIKNSDKVIYLYRENEKEQIESWVNAKKTNNFFTSWKFRNINDSYEYQYFLDLKKGFKNNFINDTNFIITYEELYYGDKIDKIIEYLGIENINKSTWPLGKKYRVDLEIKSII
jgi:hypothetical protein